MHTSRSFSSTAECEGAREVTKDFGTWVYGPKKGGTRVRALVPTTYWYNFTFIGEERPHHNLDRMLLGSLFYIKLQNSLLNYSIIA